MKSVEPYLFQHENGTFYFVRRKAGTFDRRSLSTRELAQAQKKKYEILSCEYGEIISIPTEIPPIERKAPEIAPPPSPSVHGAKKSLYEALEQHLSTIPKSSDSSEKQHRTSVNSIKKHCPNDWKSFHPVSVWNSYSETPTRKNGGKKPISGPNHLRNYLRKFVPWAVSRGWLPRSDENDMRAIPKKVVNARKIKVPGPKEIEELMLMCEDENLLRALYIRFIFATGARKSGALNLRWSDVDLASECLTLVMKGKKEKSFDLNPDAVAILQRVRDLGLDSDRVFPMTLNHARSALNMLKKYANALQIDLKILHAGRHVFASFALEAGFTPKEVAEMLGHSDGGVLVMRTYGHLIEKSYKAKVRTFRPYSSTSDDSASERAA